MSERYLDTKLEPALRAQALLEELSLEEKIAQINCVFPFDNDCNNYKKIAEGTKRGIGEVSTLEMRRMETLEDAAKWQKKVQEIVMENSEHHIPAIFHMEGLCGAFIQDSTSFPSGIGRGAGFKPELEEKIAEIVSRQEAACGITHVLGPVLDISRDSRMGRREKLMGKIRYWRPLSVQHIPEGYRREKRQAAVRKVLQNIFWPFTILREVSMERPVIHPQGFLRKSTESLFRQRYRRLVY